MPILKYKGEIKGGTGLNKSTTPWSLNNVTNKIDLRDFSLGSPCFYALVNFEDLTNYRTIKVQFVFYEKETTKTLLSWSQEIPTPQTQGGEFWAWYSVYAYLTHSPGEIEAPGEYGCLVRVTEGNTIIGIQILEMEVVETEVTPTPPEPEPPGGTPLDVIFSFIISTFETILGLTTGGFVTLLSTLAGFVSSLTSGFWDFMADPIGKIKEWSFSFFREVANVAFYFINPLISLIADRMDQLTAEEKSGFNLLENRLGKNVTDFLRFTHRIGKTFNRVKDEIGKAIDQWARDRINDFNAWKDSVAAHIDGLLKGVGVVWDNIFNEVGKNIQGALDDLGARFMEELDNLRNVITTIVRDFVTKLFLVVANEVLKGINDGFDEEEGVDLDEDELMEVI